MKPRGTSSFIPTKMPPKRLRQPSMPDRFPNQFSVKATVWTPQGSKLDLSGPISDAAGKLILGAFCNRKPSPVLLKAMEELAEKLLSTPKKKVLDEAQKTAKPRS